MLTALLIPQDGPAREITINPENSLAELQKLVGGYIEATYSVRPKFDDVVFFANEEGLFNPDCHINLLAVSVLGHPVVGDIVALGAGRGGESASLTDQQIADLHAIMG